MFRINSLMLAGIIGWLSCLEKPARKRMSIGLCVLGLLLILVEVVFYLYLNTPFFDLFFLELLSS